MEATVVPDEGAAPFRKVDVLRASDEENVIAHVHLTGKNAVHRGHRAAKPGVPRLPGLPRAMLEAPLARALSGKGLGHGTLV